VAFFSGLLSGLPFSFTAHAKDIYTSDPRQLREKIVLARFVITCTQYNRDYLKRLAPGGQTPIDCIYHGIDPRLFVAAGCGESKGRQQEPWRLLTVARLTAKKGLPTVLETLCRLRDRGVAFEHVLIGDGELRDETLALIRRLGLTGFTRWLGTQPHDVVLEHYRRADVFLLGCRIAPNGDRDGIPNVLMEAMAMGVPVVATRVSAIPELVQHRRTGMLVPPEDPEAMTQAVLELFGDPELEKQIVTRARERVIRHFDNQVLIRRLADHFRAALAAS
jgi:glycosyltransferase involved in cell wall biosynthesis